MGLKFLIVLSIIVLIFCVVDVEAFHRTLEKNIKFIEGCDEPQPGPPAEELGVAIGGAKLPKGLIKVIKN
jgi:hypothetical protein